MVTEFILSTRLIFWGAQLNPLLLLEEMKLDPKFCGVQIIEEAPVKKSDEKSYPVKTG